MKWFRPSKEEQKRVDQYNEDVNREVSKGKYRRSAEQKALQNLHKGKGRKRKS